MAEVEFGTTKPRFDQGKPGRLDLSGRLPCEHGSGDGDVLEFDRINSERILIEETEIGPLATGNRADLVLQLQDMRRAQGDRA